MASLINSLIQISIVIVLFVVRGKLVFIYISIRVRADESYFKYKTD